MRVALLTVALLLAGCAGAPATSPDAGSTPPAVTADPTFRIDATDCAEGGAYVTWNAIPDDPDLPPGFDMRDVSEDLGDPPTTSLGGGPSRAHTPLTAMPGSNVTGAYHPIMHCATWTLDGVEKPDLWIAWVAGLVHAPAFDPAPVAREYSMGAIGVVDQDLFDRLLAAGLQPELLTVTDFALDASNMRNAFAFDHHGVIYADIPMRSLGEKPAETIRLWGVSPNFGEASRPVALDLHDEGGEHLVASAPGAFEHTVSGPAPAAIVPVHTFSSWALGYTGVTRSITLGPAVNVTIDADGHVH